MGSFADIISDFAKETPERMTAVYRRSVEMLADEMTRTKANGGRVPVDTGALYRSLLASKEDMPKVSNTIPAGNNVGIVTATLAMGQPVWLGYTMAYARRQNSGFVGADSLGRVYNVPGNYFVEYAIAKWPQIVAAAAKEVQAGVEGKK